jgi:hypothetical protein
MTTAAARELESDQENGSNDRGDAQWDFAPE